jgi:YVTN family beta-propeller protein
MNKTILAFGTLLATAFLAVSQINHSSALAAGNAPKAYVGLFKDNAVGVIDTGTNKMITTIPIPKGPHGMEISADGKFVYVSNEGSTMVSVIDTASDKISQSIEVGPSPHGLALSRDGTRLLVAVNGADNVAVVDTKTNAVISGIA